MRQRLTSGERRALRRLDEQLSQEAPELAAALRRPAVPATVRWSPLRWSAVVYLVLAVVLLVIGVLLEVDSAVAASMGCLVAAGVRMLCTHRELRGLLADARSRTTRLNG
jgi:hypothetical protein